MNTVVAYAFSVSLLAGQASEALFFPSSRASPPEYIIYGGAHDPPLLTLVRGGYRGNLNRANVGSRQFNSGNFRRDVSSNHNFSASRNVNVNRNVSVNRNVAVGGGYYGPNWGGVAAGVAVGAGVTAMATTAAAASRTYYPAPPPYPYYP